MFSEDARIVTVTTEVNEFGEPTHTESEEAIKCATAPPTGNEPRVRELIEGGVLLEAMRNFWTVQDLRPVQYGNTGTAGDIIEYQNERWRVTETQRWGGFSESLCVRIEKQ